MHINNKQNANWLSNALYVLVCLLVWTSIEPAYGQADPRKPILIPGTRQGDPAQYHKSGNNATIPGEVTAPYPTIINLAVEWKIEGDDNLNGVVTLKYRKVGSTEWKTGMPLRRIPGAVRAELRPKQSWANKHSGSLFDLEPDLRGQAHQG